MLKPSLELCNSVRTPSYLNHSSNITLFIIVLFKLNNERQRQMSMSIKDWGWQMLFFVHRLADKGVFQAEAEAEVDEEEVNAL
jgi:hypothetical protein